VTGYRDALSRPRELWDMSSKSQLKSGVTDARWDFWDVEVNRFADDLARIGIYAGVGRKPA
jgi:hypothetical protein